VAHHQVGIDFQRSLPSRDSGEHKDAIGVEMLDHIEGQKRGPSSFVNEIDVADLSGDLWERMSFGRKVTRADHFQNVGFGIRLRLTSLDVSIEPILYQCHRSQHTHGPGAKNNRAVTMRVRFPGSDWAAPREALLHVPNLDERLLGDR